MSTKTFVCGGLVRINRTFSAMKSWVRAVSRTTRILFLLNRSDRLLVLGVRKLAVIADCIKATVLSILLTVI